jgi:hypothetical protein
MPFPVDEKYIIQTEEKLGVRFSRSFRNRMMLKNGGEVVTESDGWELFPFLDSSDKIRLKRTCNDIIRETAAAKEWDGFPSEALAGFAQTSFFLFFDLQVQDAIQFASNLA